MGIHEYYFNHASHPDHGWRFINAELAWNFTLVGSAFDENRPSQLSITKI